MPAILGMLPRYCEQKHGCPPTPMPVEGGKKLSDFYTQPEPRRLLKQYIRALLTRRNTYTGRLYSEEPCILG